MSTTLANLGDLARQADAAWQQALKDEQAGRLDEAYAALRRIHDLVVDCPRLHHMAHQHLRRVNIKRRAWRELFTDLVLLALAPLAIFEIVAFMMKRQVLGGVVCARARRPARS
jgi:hypothetical protein